MKNWDDYQLILALEKAGTIRGTAQLLGVNHSTVSRRLSQIERKLDQAVFEKTPKGYKPTNVGLVLIDHAIQMQSIVYVSNRQLSAMEGSLSGDLSLSIPDAIGQYLLVDSLAEFSAKHPLINLNVSSSYNLVNLNENEADVVVRGTANPPDYLVGRKLFPYFLCCYAHKDYLKSTDREDMRWICAPFTGIQPAWIKHTQYKDVAVGMQIADVTMRHIALCNGLGLSKGACYMAEQNPNIVRLAGSKPEAATDLWVLTHPDRRHTPKIKALMQHLIDAISAKQALITGSRYRVEKAAHQ